MKIEQKQWDKKNSWTNINEDNIGKKAQLVLVFGKRELLKTKRITNQIKKYYPKANIIGCSTSGNILDTEVEDNTLSLTAVYFEKTKIKTTTTTISKTKSYKSGQELAKKLNKKDLSHIFVLSEGLNVNGSELVKGIRETLPKNVAVTGGLAGDQDKFQETIILSNNSTKKNIVTAIGFYGKSIKITYGSMGGWDSFGPDRLVTKSKNNILYELDGKNALNLYKKYLGPKAKKLPASGLLFPLSLRLKNQQMLVRTILSINEKEGSMTFAGDIPEGAYVRLMKANMERLVDGAAEAAKKSKKKKSPELAILISCVGRKLVLKQRIEEEVEAVKDTLGKKTKLTGFYSYGEICPILKEQGELHNQTMTITTISE